LSEQILTEVGGGTSANAVPFQSDSGVTRVTRVVEVVPE
jgi:hypothetical protein